MQLWWELHDKYRDELLNHTTFKTDEQMEQFVHIAESPKPKKRKNQKLKGKGKNANNQEKTMGNNIILNKY